MNVRKIIIALPALAAAFVLAAGCQKSPLETMSGSYTYKTSGRLRLVSVKSRLLPINKDTVWYYLLPEQGQMNIVPSDAGNSRALVTWNNLTGDACSADAGVSGNTLTITSAVKTVSLVSGVLDVDRGKVTYSGTGTLYDNMLIIPLEYSGYFVVGSDSLAIVSSEVECVAKAN